ncbi:MAG TPA: 5'-nucleotidase C-terminal domain-containing protein [Kofleriaceae bacterium]|nr:5'-nucleotidase C-terminal domain-containing protein [Kofleriaceae bacterium]
MRSNLAAVAVVLLLGACGDDGGEQVVTYGEVTVDLDLAETGTRATETLIGNLAADAFMAALAAEEIDAAFIGGGGLRCPEELDAMQCQGYVIEAGPVTSADLEIILPFANELVIKDVTGAALRSTLERSVSVIPSERKGWFLHPSASLRYAADCAQSAQVVDADGTAIEQEGARITGVTIGGVALDDEATYSVATTAFVAAGGDGHVALGEAEPTTMTGVTERQAIADYIMSNSPVTPMLDGRIELTAACAVP